MKCQICHCETDRPEVFKIWNEEYSLCGWDALRVKQYIDGNIAHSVINIYWGAGHICWSSWNSLRDFIRANGIKEVLEIGSGLSSEMFVAEGLSVISFDVWREHVELYKEHQGLKDKAVFHWYDDALPPPVKKLYPGRKWDFVFVDSPQERADEVKVAMEVSSKYIYLHDPNLGEQSFFPNDDWFPVDGKESKLFKKIERQ